MNPEEVATLAKHASVKRLCLMHFNPALYPTLESRKAGEAVAQAIFKETTCMVDDQKIEI